MVCLTVRVLLTRHNCLVCFCFD
uniref:Uncharacterized protein n=1 Tax=Lepeophtheirus salmonis TaxID=72036 RepID=A0A0K2V8V9_LEPSM